MAEVFGQAPIATPLIDQQQRSGRVSPFWLQWFDALVRIVQGIRYQESVNVGTINAGESVTAAVDVPGAQPGDFVLASVDQNLQGMVISGYVESAGKVAITLSNATTSNVTLPVSLFRVYVRPGTL